MVDRSAKSIDVHIHNVTSVVPCHAGPCPFHNTPELHKDVVIYEVSLTAKIKQQINLGGQK